ncbi:FAS1 domain-containing protein [Xylariaceae sp. AK1471]|nr:FAS1 domain-containing protein [Xylariaceae sp. AK1471]
MRYTSLLPLAAAVVTAVVIPDDATAQQLSLEINKKPVEKTISGWWDTLRSTAEDTLDAIGESTHKLLDDLSEIDLLGSLVDTDVNWPGHGRHGHVGRPGHHGTTNLTVYQAIQASNFTKKFATLVNDFPDIVDLLNSTKANVTVFIPIDKAFEKIPKHGHKPPKEFVEKFIEYHILPGYYPARRVLAHHTLPTALKGEALGGRPQRLRVSVGLFGVRINFYSKVIVANLFAKNGIVHGVDSILVPPPPARRLISLFPSKFSTFELAAEKTGLVPHHEHHDKDGKDDDDHKNHKDHHLTGLTVFAPTNFAFRKLGPAANAFLFNTEKGLGYLRALLKYHLVANETLYSDAYYGLEGHSEDLLSYDESEQNGDKGGTHNGHFHVDLPTLLGDKSLSIDIARWHSFINIRINGYTNVAIEDAIARNGVVQILNSVLIPPHEQKHEGAWTEEDGEIPVEELIERLKPYVEEDVEDKKETVVDAGKGQVWGEL